jgi:hypothetical protein
MVSQAKSASVRGAAGEFQAGIAAAHGGDYASILSWTMALAALALILVTAFGPEARAVQLRVRRSRRGAQ